PVAHLAFYLSDGCSCEQSAGITPRILVFLSRFLRLARTSCPRQLGSPIDPPQLESIMRPWKWLAVAALICFPAASLAEDKPDYAKLLVGKWEVTKADEGTVPAGTIVEFTKDNKFKVSGKKDDADMSFDGSYTVKDDTFTFTLKIGDNESTQTITITKISATEMATKNKEGKVVELKKKA